MSLTTPTAAAQDTACWLDWQASTAPGLPPYEFELLVRSVIDVTAVSFLIAAHHRARRAPTSWDDVSRAYRDMRNERLKTSSLRYSNPFEFSIELVNAINSSLVAAAAIGTLLVTGSALRKKYLAEARKANVEADRAEFDLAVLANASVRAEEERGFVASSLPPEADGTWEDVALVVGGGEQENDVDLLIGQFARNAGINRQIMVMRNYRFDVTPRK